MVTFNSIVQSIFRHAICFDKLLIVAIGGARWYPHSDDNAQSPTLRSTGDVKTALGYTTRNTHSRMENQSVTTLLSSAINGGGRHR